MGQVIDQDEEIKKLFYEKIKAKIERGLPWWKRDYDVFRKVMDNMEKKDKEITGLDDSEFFDLFKKS